MKWKVHSLIPAFCILILITCCHTQPIQDNDRLVRTWIDLLNKHDTVAISNMYSDSARMESPNWEGIKTGPAEVKTIYARYFLGTSDLHHVITHIIVTDSSAVVEYESGGTFLNPEKGTPVYMQGKKYDLQNCTRMTIMNGKIISQKNYFDQVAFLRQVGFFDPH